MIDKKGQAAMEFLVTYGWAIMAAIIAIAVLAYFGIFTPGGITGNAVAVTTPFYTTAANLLVTPSEMNIEIKHNLDKTLTINSIIVTGTGPTEGVVCSTTPLTPLQSNVLTVYTLSCAGALNEGDQFIGEIEITYTKTGNSLEEFSTGNIKTVVQ
jgi:uncharacterized protein (UPF0333 family)